MFDQSGLSLDQAPPICVVFRLFLSGAFFGILGGAGMIYWGVEIFDSSSSSALMITHIFTLGVMLSFMLGALFQMLPVIAGVALSNPKRDLNIIQLPFIVGIFSLLLGFWSSGSLAFIIAGVLLGAALLYTVFLMLSRLIQIRNHSASSRGMVYALISLSIVVLLGVYMNSVLAGLMDGTYLLSAKKIHYSYGLFGWIALLVISISYQVIEMFYVTPAYPTSVSRWMPLWIVSILVLLTISVIFFEPLVIWFDALLFVSLSAFGLLTLVRLSQRKRPIVDASMWFWRLGMGSLIASMAMLLANLVSPITLLTQIATVLFGTFATSILLAMLYKIVPFLTWFHLNSQGYLMAPMMHEIVHPKVARQQLQIYIVAVISLILSLFAPIFIYFAGLFTVLTFAWAGYQVIKAWKLYKYTKETTEKFNF